MKFIRLTILLLLFCLNTNAQEQTHKSTINTEAKVGLQKIELTPAHEQFMSSDYKDVRVIDNSAKEIPYVILSEPMMKSKTDFVEYTIRSQKHFNSYSEIIIENKNADKISNIAFNINNSDALKYCSVEGSNDLKQWFSVSALQELSLAYNDNYTNQFKCIYFPLNNYTYFRLLIEDWQANPFKVNKAGYFINSVISGKLNNVSLINDIKTDVKAKTTTAKLIFNANQSINHIQFKISNPRLYLRQATIYVLEEDKIKNKPSKFYKNQLYSFELNADKPLLFDIPEINNREVFIEIENNDNQPLQIDSIICKQLASYLVFDVAQNNNYTIECGNMQLNKPIYDLFAFVNESPQLIPNASLGEFKNIETVKTVVAKETKFYETKLFLWACILIGVLAIGLFSYKLMVDMNATKKD